MRAHERGAASSDQRGSIAAGRNQKKKELTEGTPKPRGQNNAIRKGGKNNFTSGKCLGAKRKWKKEGMVSIGRRQNDRIKKKKKAGGGCNKSTRSRREVTRKGKMRGQRVGNH